MPYGKGCTTVTLLLCLVVSDSSQEQEKALWGQCTLNRSAGSLHPPAPSQCVAQGEGEPFWDCRCPQSGVWLPQGLQGCVVCICQRKDADSTRTHPGWKVTLVVSPHFGKGALGRYGAGGRRWGGDGFGNLPSRFRRG